MVSVVQRRSKGNNKPRVLGKSSRNMPYESLYGVGTIGLPDLPEKRVGIALRYFRTIAKFLQKEAAAVDLDHFGPPLLRVPAKVGPRRFSDFEWGESVRNRQRAAKVARRDGYRNKIPLSAPLVLRWHNLELAFAQVRGIPVQEAALGRLTYRHLWKHPVAASWTASLCEMALPSSVWINGVFHGDYSTPGDAI
jgi:hypothetical protein